MSSIMTTTRSPASRRLMRKRRSGLGIEVAIRSDKKVIPMKRLATNVTIDIRMQ